MVSHEEIEKVRLNLSLYSRRTKDKTMKAWCRIMRRALLEWKARPGDRDLKRVIETNMLHIERQMGHQG